MEDYTLIPVEDVQVQHLEFKCHYEAYSDNEDGSWAGHWVIDNTEQ
jgi:hypothetical protein